MHRDGYDGMGRGELRELLTREMGRRMERMGGECGRGGHDRRMFGQQGGPRGPFGPGEGFGGGPRGPFGGGPFGPGPRGPRVRPGQLRLAVLALLGEGPRNGYGLIQEISRRSDEQWQPSPGSMYPTLAQLEDEGLIEVQPQDGKKAYALSAAGQTYAAEHQDELKAVWAGQEQAGRAGHAELRGTLRSLLGAVKQVAEVGGKTQRQQAEAILKDARKALYRLLAEDSAAE